MERDYLASVEQLVLNHEYVAARFDGKVQLVFACYWRFGWGAPGWHSGIHSGSMPRLIAVIVTFIVRTSKNYC